MIITPNLFCGGASKIISLLCENINKEKFYVVLACINKKDTFYKIDESAIKVIYFNKVHVRNAIPQLFSLIKNEKPDVVFSNGQHLNIFLAFLKKFFSKKMQFIARETSILSINNTEEKYSNVFNFLVKKLYSNFDKIICQSKEMANDFIKNYKINSGKIKIINNPATTRLISESKNLFQSDKLRLLSIGRLSAEKGYNRLLKALNKLSIPFEYIILGDGIERNKLEQQAKDLEMDNNVVFKGFINNTNDYINECDILLHGSYHEGFPNVIIEAGMYGKPAIAFEEPGIGNEVIENNFNGFLIASNDLAAYALAVEKISKMEINNQAIIDYTLKKHNVATIIKKYESLFEDSVKGNS